MTTPDRLLAALNHMRAGVLVLEADLTVGFLNAAQHQWMKRLGVDRQPSDLVGTSAADSYPLFSKDEWEGIATRVVTYGETIRWTKLPCPRVNPASYVSVDLIRLDGDNGRRPGILCMTEDVTHGAAVDRELIKKERLALVGQTSVALLHEISNPLAAILGSAEALLFSRSLGLEAAKRIEAIKLNALRIAEITRKLRELEDLQLTEYLHGGPVYVTAEPRSS